MYIYFLNVKALQSQYLGVLKHVYTLKIVRDAICPGAGAGARAGARLKKMPGAGAGAGAKHFSSGSDALI